MSAHFRPIVLGLALVATACSDSANDISADQVDPMRDGDPRDTATKAGVTMHPDDTTGENAVQRAENRYFTGVGSLTDVVLALRESPHFEDVVSPRAPTQHDDLEVPAQTASTDGQLHEGTESVGALDETLAMSPPFNSAFSAPPRHIEADRNPPLNPVRRQLIFKGTVSPPDPRGENPQ